MDVVCANQLSSYKAEVRLVTQSTDAPPTVAGAIAGDETEDVAVSGVDCRVLRAEGGVDIEPPLIAALAALHGAAMPGVAR